MSDTPRTDRAAFYPGLNDDYDDFSIDGTCVYATVARGLERENNALRAYAFEMASAMRIAGDSGSASGEALARAECAQLRLHIAKLRAAIDAARGEGGAT